MPRRIISLNDSNWRVGSVDQKSFTDVNDFADARDWLPAQVPGDVRLDLLRAGKISDPFFADNNESSQWIDARDWWYTRDVELDLRDDERVFLVVEGIDYQSAIFWNGEQLGRHAGMFSRQTYELPRHASHVTRHASLAIRIWGSNALPKLNRTLAQKLWARLVKPLFHPPDQPFPDRYATLKCQMQFGWDFAPRLRTCGIWDDASIVIVRSVFIQDAWIKSKVKSEKEKVSDVQVSLTLDSDREQSARVVCDLRGKNFQCDAQTFAFDLRLGRGKQTYPVAFAFSDVRVWNPWDRGDPNLYEIEIRVESADGSTFDSLTDTFGIRSFELQRAPDPPARAEPWTFVVNGTHEFVRGANWVPLDAIPARLTRDDYATRLEQAREANINFLRVWGGGLREKRAFYDLCDELGILVWQEFPFAGAILDRFPTDPAFLKHTRDECSAIVCALRNHPSLVVWCGGNEFSVSGNRKIVKTLQAVARDNDGTRPFKPASPYRDESHNWRVWHRFANLRDYKRDETPFLSEFGLQAVPNRESLEKFLPQDALNTPNALWEYHHAQVKKLARYATTVIASREAAKQSPIRQSEIASSQSEASLAGNPLLAMTPTFIDATQRAQAIGLQIAIEHIRRRKGKTSGVAIWQFNDCAPAISWSIVDYYGTPKRAYEELKRLYSPVLASFDYKLVQHRAGDIVYGDLWIINDLRSSFQNAQVTACLNDKEIFTRRINIAPDSAELVDTLAVPLGEGENILRLKVNWGPPTLSDHVYDLNFCDVGEIGLMDTLMATVGKQLMR